MRIASQTEIEQVALVCRARMGDLAARRILTNLIAGWITNQVSGQQSEEIIAQTCERTIDTFALKDAAPSHYGPLFGFSRRIAINIAKDEKKSNSRICYLEDQSIDIADRINYGDLAIANAQLSELDESQAENLRQFIERQSGGR